ncbi:MAG: Holliday junction resolvase RecU [Bacteroidales bacterium]|nr:Holliday junction resolvase RecU [Anaerotignum sp.]MCI5680164.1 Holliday junction resolvase RecU [Bacteroidales bacterium]MDY3926854.1 Holliday junction resolvase RecU [Anaerotignum sp.]
MEQYNPRKNNEGYTDLTAYEVEKKLQGKRSKMVGALFEQMISASCRYYREAGIAVIEKTPEPMKPLSKMDKRGQFKACFTKAAQPDYKGTLQGGRTLIFEAKHTDKETITYNRLTEAQMDAMEAYHEMGAECFILVSFSFCDFYRIPWTEWNDMQMLYGRKYMKRCELERYRIKEKGDVLYFLDGLEAGAENG